MTTADDMKIDYAVVLKQLRQDLDGLDGRRQVLLASIAAMSRLVDGSGSEPLPDANAPVWPGGGQPNGAESSTVKMPVIPPGFFSGKTPTQAYRDLMRVWPGHYRAPQIADLFIQGGMVTKDRTALVQAIHSVLKRERKREQRGLAL